MSGRIRNDVSASFMTPRFLVPIAIVAVVVIGLVWFLHGRA